MWSGPEMPPPDPKVVWEMISSPPGKIVTCAVLGMIGAGIMESNILLGLGLGLLAGMLVVIIERK